MRVARVEGPSVAFVVACSFSLNPKICNPILIFTCLKTGYRTRVYLHERAGYRRRQEDREPCRTRSHRRRTSRHPLPQRPRRRRHAARRQVRRCPPRYPPPRNGRLRSPRASSRQTLQDPSPRPHRRRHRPQDPPRLRSRGRRLPRQALHPRNLAGPRQRHRPPRLHAGADSHQRRRRHPRPKSPRRHPPRQGHPPHPQAVRTARDPHATQRPHHLPRAAHRSRLGLRRRRQGEHPRRLHPRPPRQARGPGRRQPSSHPHRPRRRLHVHSGLMPAMRYLSVRAKLMLLYLLVTFAGLVLFGLISFGALQYALLQGKKTHLQGREERLIAFLKENKTKGVTLPLDEQLRNYALVTHEGNLFHIHNSDGTLLFPRETLNPDPLTSTSASRSCTVPIFTSVQLDHQPVLVMCHMIPLNGQMVRLHLGGSLEEQLEILRTYRKALLLLMPGLLILSTACGYLLNRHALKPVDRMTRAALGIGIGNLSERLPVPSAKDEVQHLAVAWNQLLARLEAAVSRLSRFSADASHDLRTSITVMLATAQLSLHRRHRTEPEYREDLGKIVTECRTAATLLDALLSLARSDNFIHEVAFKQINLCDLVVTGCRRVEDLAESSGIMLDWYLPKEPVHIEGDDLLLQRLLGILLDNAIRYTPEHGEIRAEVSLTANEAILTVRDTGIGMSGGRAPAGLRPLLPGRPP